MARSQKTIPSRLNLEDASNSSQDAAVAQVTPIGPKQYNKENSPGFFKTADEGAAVDNVHNNTSDVLDARRAGIETIKDDLMGGAAPRPVVDEAVASQVVARRRRTRSTDL